MNYVILILQLYWLFLNSEFEVLHEKKVINYILSKILELIANTKMKLQLDNEFSNEVLVSTGIPT